jgi:hypothetical protein
LALRKTERDNYSNLHTVEGGKGGGPGAESYDHKKAWPTINNSVLSGVENVHGNVIIFEILDSIIFSAGVWIISMEYIIKGGSHRQPRERRRRDQKGKLQRVD